MYIFRSLIAGALLSVNAIGAVQAAIITETWQSTVTGTNYSAFKVGDVFTWTVTYDDASLIGHQYGDGTNELAEQGEGDDYLWATNCAGALAYTTGCNAHYSDWTLFADAVIDIASFYDRQASYYNPYTGNYLAGEDNQISNYSWRASHPLGNEVSFFADDLKFYATDVPGYGYAYTYYRTAYGELGRTETNFSSVIVSTDSPLQVPEPTSFALMGLGLAGLVFSLRQRKQV